MTAEPAKFVWSPDSVDALIATLSKKAEGVRVNANKKVMLRAASRDMLTVVGPLRDLLELAAKGDKEMLKQIFGGSGIRRFHSIRDILEKTPLEDEMCKDDIRYVELKTKVDIIEEILKQLGLFKMWDMKKGIAGLIPKGVPKRIVQGTHYRFTPEIVDGGEPTEYILTDVNLMVIAPEPIGLAYPPNGETVVGTEVSWEPTVEHADCATYTIEPPLPVGLVIHPTNGSINGTPEVKSEMTTYTITAENIAGSCTAKFDIFVDELRSSEQEVILRLATELEECTDLGSLPAEPNKGGNPISWMLWMVHRAHLNDPTLTDFNFTGIGMPLPDEEPRVSPKLMKALAGNTHIVNLDLANSNLQRKEGGALAESLGKNSTLRTLNVESNHLDLEALTAIANSLTVASGTSALEVWKFSNQRVFGTNFGRPFEAVASNLVEKNKNITKLGFSPVDRHWLNQINKALLRNVDIVRRRRTGHLSGGC